MKYNTIIFDLDGTLLNSLEDLCDSVNAALTVYQYPTRTLSEVKSFVGNGVGMLVKRALPQDASEETFTKVLDAFKKHYELHMQDKTRPYSGILPMLDKLKEVKLSTAIASNKFDLAVKKLAKQYFGDCIDLAIGESETIPKKPSPEGVNQILSDLHSQKEKAIYIGDSETDVQTAKNAGVLCIGVTWGFRTRETLLQEGADYIVDTAEELLSLILSLCQIQ